MKLTPAAEAALKELLQHCQTAEPEPVGTVAVFSLADATPGEDGEYVTRKGKIFAAGDYPDKGVSFSESDLENAASAFQPVKNDLEHLPHKGVKTILDGKLGNLAAVRREGGVLFGDVRVPRWLNDLLGTAPLKVSLAFDKAKRIVGNALVLDPRIEGAEVVAAFSAAQSPLGPAPTVEPSAPRNETSKPMKNSLLTAIAALFSVAADAETVAATPAPDVKPDVTLDAKPGAAFARDDSAEVTRLKAELAAALASKEPAEVIRLGEKAALFADECIQTHKAVPAERDAIIAAFTVSVQADSAGNATLFSADGQLVEGVGVQSLRAIYAARPAHTLTKETSEAKVVFANTTPDVNGITAERRKELLASTDAGRQLLKEGK